MGGEGSDACCLGLPKGGRGCGEELDVYMLTLTDIERHGCSGFWGVALGVLG